MAHHRIALPALLLAAAAAQAAGAAQAQPPDNAIRLDAPADGWTVKKVAVSDCRAVRGAFGSPVDGSVRSWDYSGRVCEYPRSAGGGVGYAYNRNDGVHLTLADGDGFDAVVLRGGARTRLYADAGSLTEPQGVPPLCAFAGPGPVETVRFAKRIKESRVVLFGAEGGTIADVSFYRIEPGPRPSGSGAESAPRASGSGAVKRAPAAAPQAGPAWRPAGELAIQPPASPYAPESIYRAMAERYPEGERRALALGEASGPGEPVRAAKDRALHFITPPLPAEQGLAAVTLEASLAAPAGLATATTPGTARPGRDGGQAGPYVLTAAVQDPLDPRLDLVWADLTLPGPGPVRVTLDIPDQVLLAGSRLWVTLRFGRDAVLSGPEGGAPVVRPHFVPRERALPEALARRKFLLKTFFSLMSEPRPWGSYRKQSREAFYASGPYAKQCPELFMTIDLCHALDPADALVRQYREWAYLGNLPALSDVSPPPAPPAGVPAWAWYPRLAWLEARRIADWWVRERMVPTGEFGGRVGDDSDMYQQYPDLPFFEDGGTGAALKDGAARMAELADRENLRGGLNRSSTDALHAYEEGINHLALMARWFYGDPIYLERCMDSARNLVHLTVRTADGRRHFRDNQNMGARDMEKPRPPAVDGHASPLMWHAALQAADYNRNPQALALIREWADTWLGLMKPGQWATDVEVLTGKVVGFEKDRPLYGGYRSQACVFAWLAHLTGDPRYVEPLLCYARRGQAPLPVNGFLGDLYCLGFLEGLDARAAERLLPASPPLALYLKGDPQPLISDTIGSQRPSGAAVGTLYDARRWPDMYTTAEQFTDRVFPSVLEDASVSYLGGFTRRNKFNPAQAVSWEGYGTDYAALVTVNRRDHLKALVYSYAAAPMRGRMRIWALVHGCYRLTVGPDADGDMQADGTERSETLELARAEAVELTLPPRQVTVVELRQVARLDPIFARADLALAAREVEVAGAEVKGVVHNVGAADAPEAVVAVTDAGGRVLARESLGPLAAPLDLAPKRRPFTLRLPGPPGPGWKLAVDPERRVPEIYEGNNEVPLGPGA